MSLFARKDFRRLGEEIDNQLHFLALWTTNSEGEGLDVFGVWRRNGADSLKASMEWPSLPVVMSMQYKFFLFAREDNKHTHDCLSQPFAENKTTSLSD